MCWHRPTDADLAPSWSSTASSSVPYVWFLGGIASHYASLSIAPIPGEDSGWKGQRRDVGRAPRVEKGSEGRDCLRQGGVNGSCPRAGYKSPREGGHVLPSPCCRRLPDMAVSSGVPMASPGPPRFAHHQPHDSISLHSFRVTAPYALASSAASTASAPSLKAASLRVRGALAIAHLLGSRGRPAFAPPDEPRLADLTHPSDFPPKSPPSKMAQLPKNSTPPHPQPPLSPTAAAPSPPAKQAMRANSKSRTIIRMLTTKFTPRSSPSTTRRGLATPPPPNAFSAERRAAALRERGLLPPLPARDLSTQEMEQDMRIPVVRASTDGTGLGPGGDEGVVSAADLIKKEWEAKNSAASAPSTGSCSALVDDSGTSDENADTPPATTPTPAPGLVDAQPVDAEALNRERMRGFRFGGGSTPPTSNPGLTSQHQQPDQHQEGHTEVDKTGSPERKADSDAQERDSDDMPRPLPLPPRSPRAPSPSSSPLGTSASSLSSSPPSVAFSPPTPISTSVPQFTPTTPLSPPPTDALPPLPPSPLPSSPSRSSTISRPLPSPPTTPSARQIHPDLQAFTFPLPPSPAASAPAFVLNLSEAAGRPSEESSSSLDLAPADMEAWAAALPPIPPSPAPSVRSSRSALSLRSTQGLRAALPMPMPSSPPPPTPASPSMAQAQALPLPSSSGPPAISLTPPVGSFLADVGISAHARDDSFALLAASMSIVGANADANGTMPGDSGSASERRSEGLHDRAANGDREVQFPSSLSLSAPASASAPEWTAEAPLSSSASSPSSALAPSSPAASPTRTAGLIPKGKLGALTVQTHTVSSAIAAPVLVVVESPPGTAGSGLGKRWSEELDVVVEEQEHEGELSGKRSPGGSVTPTPSLGAATMVGGGATPTSTVNTAATAITDVFGPKRSVDEAPKRTSQESSASDDAANPAQYVYARPPGAGAPLVASPTSSSHSHSLSNASSSSSFSAAAAASSSLGGASSPPPTPATFAARVPLPPTPTTPAIRVSSPTSPGANKRGSQKRGLTDPASGAEKRKTFNPFKRSASALATSGGGGDGPTRRLSVAASLSQLRRSITSSSSAPSANGSTGRTFNASHLPPSPTPHSGFNSAINGSANGAKVVRQAVAPIVYSRGTILAETSAIEDEESRRMTELAFLG